MQLIVDYSPIKLVRKMVLALSTVFSTSSSAATLPVTLECLLKKVGVSNRVASFVLPIGTTLNMDGTALYQVSAAIFLAQVYDIQLAFWHYAIIGLTAIFASIGAAGLPSTGLFTLVIILNSVNIPLEGIGLILGVDRILDMCRSMVNVWGNACSTVVVAKLEGERF